jgi:hypothetical protein
MREDPDVASLIRAALALIAALVHVAREVAPTLEIRIGSSVHFRPDFEQSRHARATPDSIPPKSVPIIAR